MSKEVEGQTEYICLSETCRNNILTEKREELSNYAFGSPLVTDSSASLFEVQKNAWVFL